MPLAAPRSPSLSLAALVLLLPLCVGCASTRFVEETWTNYEVNAPLEGPSSPLTAVVLPFCDERFSHGDDPAQEPGGWHRFRMLRHQEDAQLKVLFARWLAKDLQASGVFAGARSMRWRQLLDSSPAPDLVITGVVRVDEARVHWIAGSRGAAVGIAVPFAPLFLLGVPIGWVDFELELEVRVYAFDDLEDPLWTKTLRAEDSAPNNMFLALGDLLDRYLFTHNETLRPLYAEVIAELKEAVQPGGAIHGKGE